MSYATCNREVVTVVTQYPHTRIARARKRTIRKWCHQRHHPRETRWLTGWRAGGTSPPKLDAYTRAGVRSYSRSEAAPETAEVWAATVDPRLPECKADNHPTSVLPSNSGVNAGESGRGRTSWEGLWEGSGR